MNYFILFNIKIQEMAIVCEKLAAIIPSSPPGRCLVFPWTGGMKQSFSEVAGLSPKLVPL